jgi:MFS family permease
MTDPTVPARPGGLAGEAESPGPPIWRVGTLSYTSRGLAGLFSWLLWGDLAYSLRDRVVPPVMQLLFKKFGASDALTGFLFASLPCVLGVMVGPLVGYSSDRLRTRWGRRIPFLFFSMPFIVLSVLGLAFCAPMGGWLHRLLPLSSPGPASSILICLGLSWTVFEISCLTANSVFGALINDVVPQEVVGRCFGVLRIGGLLVAICFNLWFFGNAEANYPWLFATVGLVYGVGFTLMCLNIKEGTYPAPPMDRARTSVATAIRTYLRDGFGHPYYLWFFAANILGSQVTVPFNVYAIFYAQDFLMSKGGFGKCLALTYLCSLCLAYPLGWLADRFHPLRVTILTLALYAATMVYGFLFAHDKITFAIALIGHGVASGTLWTVSSSLSQRLLPRAKFAEIGSAGGILGNLFGIVVAPSMGMFLDLAQHQYRYTFLAGLLLTLSALGSYLVLFVKFKTLGGPDHYVAPE